MDQAVHEGPRVEEALKDWRSAHRALAEATARRERLAAASRPEGRSEQLSAALLAEWSAAAAEHEAHERFREARQRVVERDLTVSRRAPGFGSGAAGTALGTSDSETSTL